MNRNKNVISIKVFSSVTHNITTGPLSITSFKPITTRYYLNPLLHNFLFLYPLKTSEN